MNSIVKQSRYSSMNRIISDVSGRVPMRKADTAFNNSFVSRSSWFSRRSLAFSAAKSSGIPSETRPSRRATCVPIVWPCATRRPVLVRLLGTLVASTSFRQRYDPLPSGPHRPSHPDQTSLAFTRFSHLLRRNKTWDTSFRFSLTSTHHHRLILTQPF